LTTIDEIRRVLPKLAATGWYPKVQTAEPRVATRFVEHKGPREKTESEIEEEMDIVPYWQDLALISKYAADMPPPLTLRQLMKQERWG